MDENCNFISKNSLYNLHINEKTWEDVAEYKEDYAEVIRNREMFRMQFGHRAPQIIYREYLIKYLKDLATNKELSHCTLHLSVYIMDIFMDNHNIAVNRILLVANCCLLLAAKVEECSSNIPRITELNAHVPYELLSTNDYRLLEIHILKHFNWSIMFPTTAHYIHYYLQAAITKRDVEIKKKSVAKIVHEMHPTITIYLDKVLDDIHYMQLYQPSILAAAIISIARGESGLDQWHKALHDFTHYSQLDIEYTKLALLEPLPLACLECNN